MDTLTLAGRLVTGLGEAVNFTRLDWAREQFVANLAIFTVLVGVVVGGVGSYFSVRRYLAV